MNRREFLRIGGMSMMALVLGGCGLSSLTGGVIERAGWQQYGGWRCRVFLIGYGSGGRRQDACRLLFRHRTHGACG